MNEGGASQMKKVLAILATILIAAYVAAILVPVDPAEQRPGTRLSGDVAGDAEWAGVTAGAYGFGESLVELETRPWYVVRHSVTTTVSVHEGRVYIPCARCAQKTWPSFVAADPAVRVRIGGVVFECTAQRVLDEALLGQLLAGSRMPSGDVWVYELTRG